MAIRAADRHLLTPAKAAVRAKGNVVPRPLQEPVTLVLPYPPSVNCLYRTFGKGGKTYRALSDQGARFKEDAGRVAVAAGLTPIEGGVSLTIHVYRPRRIGDLDGVLKSLIDSLSGIAYGDDKQVTVIHAYRHDDKSDPRVEVTVSQDW